MEWNSINRPDTRTGKGIISIIDNSHLTDDEFRYEYNLPDDGWCVVFKTKNNNYVLRNNFKVSSFKHSLGEWTSYTHWIKLD